MLCPPGAGSPCDLSGVPGSLRLLAAVSGQAPYLVLFLLCFLLSGSRLELALAPGDSFAIVAWAASFMFWLMAINFCYPLHPLTGFELLRHTLGRFVGRTILVSIALAIAVPMTVVFFWQGAKYFNLLQIWIGIWGLPQVVQIIMAIATDSVDNLPFFASSAEEAEALDAASAKALLAYELLFALALPPSPPPPSALDDDEDEATAASTSAAGGLTVTCSHLACLGSRRAAVPAAGAADKTTP